MKAAGFPFERFTQYRRYFGLAIAPNGDLLYSCDLSGQFNLWRQHVGAKGERGYAQQLTANRDAPVREIVVAKDGKSVFFSADSNGDENFQIYRLWFSDGSIESLTDEPKVQHQLSGGSVLAPNDDFLWTDNGRLASENDVVVRNLRTGSTSRPFPPGEVWAAPQFDPSFRRISAVRFVSNTEQHAFLLDRKRGQLQEVLPHSGDGGVIPIAFTADGRGIFILTDVDQEFKRLVLHFPDSGETSVIAAPKADVEAVAHAAGKRTLAWAVNEGGYSAIYAGRAGGKARRIRTPKGAIPMAIWGNPFEISPDGRFVAAMWGTGCAPPEILWVPLESGSPSYATDGMVGGVPGGPLKPPKLVRIPGPDGHAIPAWLELPKRMPAGRIPAVLSIHGGPHMQERPEWRYSGLHQYLTSQGIAVLAPNIRGSTGYGRSYQRAIDRDWGGGELEDLRACAEWLKAHPRIDAARLGVYGQSFGGFASLSCLTRLPEYWKVGVDVYGPSNLVSFLEAVPPTWRKGMALMLGDPEKDRDFLLSRSPISHLDGLRAEILVVQGGKDPRVVQAESEQIVAKLRASGRKVEYLLFEDEGHGFSRAENAVKAFSAISNFLTSRLTGG